MKEIKKFCFYMVLSVLAVLIGFRVLAGESFNHGSAKSTMVTEKDIVGELLAGMEVRQSFLSEYDCLTEVEVLGTTYGRTVFDTLLFSIEDASGTVLATALLDTHGLPDGKRWSVPFPEIEDSRKGEELTFCIQSENGTPGNAVSLFCGDSYSAGKYELESPEDHRFIVGGQAIAGQLCFSAAGKNEYPLARYYWPFAGAVFLCTVLMACRILWCGRKGKPSLFLKLVVAVVRYRFLISQLVARDFKTKYKRSIFGVLWSLLNPLLTMMVMYVVFSTLFQSSIPNFSVYLLAGILCWNFFSEVTGSCLTSITGNTALITKVYVPKYVYPLSRVLSSSINLGFSLIPLFLVLALTRTAVTPRLLLIVFPLLCLFLFSFGVGLFLASWMVFFRDTQFLWGVVSMLWMYLTPIFYDASIIPEQYMALYKANPLYHIISIMRVLVLDGVSPDPASWLICVVLSLIPLLLGALVFKKSQDRFVLYL